MFRKILLLAVLALFGGPALAAFPTVDGSEGTTISTATTTHAVNIPGDACTSDQQLVVAFAVSEVTTTVTDWNSFTQFNSSSTHGSEKLFLAYKNCSGSEGSTISFTTDASVKSQSVMFKIGGSNDAQPQRTYTNNGNDANPDPGSLTPSGGALDYLWLVVEANDGPATTSSCPTNYTTNCASAITTGGSDTSNVNVGWSWRTNNSASEDPGTYTISATETWDVATIAISPPTGGGGGISLVCEDQNQSSSATSRTLNECSGVSEDDLGVVQCWATQTTTVTWTDPTDWTEVNQKLTTVGSPTQKGYLGYKVRGSTAGQALTFSHADSAAAIICSQQWYRGIDTSTPIDVTFVEANHYQQGAGNTPNMTPKAITTNTDGAWVLLFHSGTNTISGAAGAPSGYTIDNDFFSGGTGQSSRNTLSAHKEVASAGTETPGAFTHTDVTGTMDARAWTIAIRPAAVDPSAVFTAGPNTVDTTATTIEVSFTSDTTGTVKGTVCANGDAGNAAETLAGQCSGGDGAIATISQSVTADVADGDTFTGLLPSTTYDLGFVIDATDDSDLVSIADETTDAVGAAAVNLFWRAEGTTLDPEDDYSAGDTTATANGGASISSAAERVGTNGILTTDGADYFSLNDDSIVNTAVGSFGFWVQATTAYTAGTSELGISAYDGATNNKIAITQDTSQEFQLRLRKDGQSAFTLSTTTANAVEDTWYFLVGRYDIANDDRRIEVYDTSLNLIQGREDLTTDLANAQMSAVVDLRIGNAGSHSSPIWVDNIFWSDEYSAPLQDFALITSFQPTLSSVTAGDITETAITVNYTSDQDGTAFWVACPNGQTATRQQVLDGDCSGGAAVSAFNEEAEGGVADSGTFTGLSPTTTYDIFGEFTSGLGGTTSAQASLANQTTDTPAAAAGITFFWRAEGTTLDATHDKTAGDNTASATGGATISATAERVGTNGILTSGANSRFDFDSASIVSETIGSFAGWVQWKTTVPSSGISGPIEVADVGQDDEISINPAASQEFMLRLRNDGTAFINLTTTGVNAAVDTWYYVVGRYNITNDDRRLEVYDTNLTLIEAIEDLTTDLSVQAPSGLDALRFGNAGSHTNAIWVDNVFFSQEYNAPLQDYGLITSFKPTYTSGPTNGAFTTTELLFSFTVDQKGTTYGAACTNGQTVTSFANLKSGTCSGGAAVGTGLITVEAGVGGTVTIDGLVAGTTYDVYIGHETNIGGQSDISSLADRATTGGGGAVAFDTAPHVTTQSQISYNIGYDANTAANDIFCGCYLETATAPTGSELEAGTGATGTATEATTGSSDSIVLTCSESDKLPVHDLYCVLEDTGVGYSAVAPMLDEFLDEPGERDYIAKNGSPTGSEEGLFDDASPAIANEDIMDVPELVDSFDLGEKAHLWTVNTDTTFVVKITHDALDQTLSTPDLSRQSVCRRFYDRSLAAWSDSSCVLYYVNNKFPQYIGPQDTETEYPYLYEKDASLSIPLDGWWVDEENDELTHTITNMPPGGTLTSNETITGAFTTLGYYPGVVVEVEDVTTDTSDETVEFIVGARLPPVTLWLKDEDLWKKRSIFEAIDSYSQFMREAA